MVGLASPYSHYSHSEVAIRYPMVIAFFAFAVFCLSALPSRAEAQVGFCGDCFGELGVAHVFGSGGQMATDSVITMEDVTLRGTFPAAVFTGRAIVETAAGPGGWRHSNIR